MADDFGAILSDRIKSHEQFWLDVGALQAAAVWKLSTGEANRHQFPATLNDTALSKLMYCASVFAQVSDEESRALAQSIALCSLLLQPDPRLVERSRSVLSLIGNYPAINYLDSHFEGTTSSLLSELQVELLKSLNTIEINGKEVALTEFQLDVWKALPSSNATAISAPTSAGKSFLVIEYLCRRIEQSESYIAVFIAPTRALLSEVQHKIERRLQGTDGIRVSTVPALDALGRGKQVFVLTQERLQVLLSVTDLVVDLLVVDEAQGLADGPRGMILQDCLEPVS